MRRNLADEIWRSQLEGRTWGERVLLIPEISPRGTLSLEHGRKKILKIRLYFRKMISWWCVGQIRMVTQKQGGQLRVFHYFGDR